MKKLAAQFETIMRTFKENYSNNLKDKKGKQELSTNLDKTYAVRRKTILVIDPAAELVQ